MKSDSNQTRLTKQGKEGVGEQIVRIIMLDTLILCLFSIIALATSALSGSMESRISTESDHGQIVHTVQLDSSSIAPVPEQSEYSPTTALISQADLEVFTPNFVISITRENDIWINLKADRALARSLGRSGQGSEEHPIHFNEQMAVEHQEHGASDPQRTSPETAGSAPANLFPTDLYDGYQISTIISAQ